MKLFSKLLERQISISSGHLAELAASFVSHKLDGKFSFSVFSFSQVYGENPELYASHSQEWIITLLFWDLFTSALADGLPLESKW